MLSSLPSLNDSFSPNNTADFGNFSTYKLNFAEDTTLPFASSIAQKVMVLDDDFQGLKQRFRYMAMVGTQWEALGEQALYQFLLLSSSDLLYPDGKLPIDGDHQATTDSGKPTVPLWLRLPPPNNDTGERTVVDSLITMLRNETGAPPAATTKLRGRPSLHAAKESHSLVNSKQGNLGIDTVNALLDVLKGLKNGEFPLDVSGTTLTAALDLIVQLVEFSPKFPALPAPNVIHDSVGHDLRTILLAGQLFGQGLARGVDTVLGDASTGQSSHRTAILRNHQIEPLSLRN